jgi:GNAT superfamily N-acetyltransferase
MNLILRALDVPAALVWEGLLDTALAESAAALGEERTEPLSARAMLERSAARSQTLVVAAQGELKSAPVALCATVPLEDPLGGPALPLIALLWVEPGLRRRGVARALVHETARLHAARGTGALAARAGHNDDALISMGERWGFVRSWELLTREA